MQSKLNANSIRTRSAKVSVITKTTITIINDFYNFFLKNLKEKRQSYNYNLC